MARKLEGNERKSRSVSWHNTKISENRKMILQVWIARWKVLLFLDGSPGLDKHTKEEIQLM